MPSSTAAPLYAPVHGYSPQGTRKLDLSDGPRPPVALTGEALKQRVYSLLCEGLIRCQWSGCETTDLSHLCIDHTADDGATDRADLRRKGARLYAHILKQWEADPGATQARYQVLCWNHNREKESRRRQALRQGGETAPAQSRSRREIRLTVSADTDDYLTRHASATRPKGVIVDTLVQFETSVASRLAAIEALLEARLPPLVAPLSDPVPPPPPAVEPVTPPPQRTYRPWTRRFGGRP